MYVAPILLDEYYTSKDHLNRPDNNNNSILSVSNLSYSEYCIVNIPPNFISVVTPLEIHSFLL